MTAPDRARLRHDWIHARLGDAIESVEPASADASFRSYWRVHLADGGTRIVMDAPPDKEDVAPWLDIAGRLRRAGVHAPQVHAADTSAGFLLLEDLGTRTYLPALDDHSVDALYGAALDTLLQMQARADTGGLPDYDEARLVAEMELLPEWFLRRHLGVVPECEEWDTIESAFRMLVDSARSQPRTFVHRDYHSRNLLVLDQGGPGVIDFQDAVLGPVTYDLVSLLRDCYIAWPIDRVDAWVEGYRRRLVEAGLSDADARRFRRWFDLMGLQRHIKVLGIFCRLWYRDGKASYLGDLPLVWRYTDEVMALYPEFEGLRTLLQRWIGGRDLRIPRGRDDTSTATP
ncbi:aminoglycoside phosphotransferase family protein [Pseudofulvimonas gallinarii]|uniref:Aminoglycoside phosphotransferase domain-containing protein n=1 Tax=Pseudofulvimonas gallinarii TaxID=634155 RepID=A0A4R3LKX1_9GAMM|nr:phosphotransferase [Pseudofulvimonas gallinarii]TCT00854.1 hypothetical protein EDC25_102223 [Pseudofulvimonas gallinarii]THD12881.1 aminoglycoside phosphotransferase [Pseudofulvimonas gallinarii]